LFAQEPNIQAAAAVCCSATTNDDEYMQAVRAYFAERDGDFIL